MLIITDNQLYPLIYICMDEMIVILQKIKILCPNCLGQGLKVYGNSDHSRDFGNRPKYAFGSLILDA